MFEIARRTLLQMSLFVGSTSPISILSASSDQTRAAIVKWVEHAFDLAPHTAWLVAERLNWNGDWPQLIATGADLGALCEALTPGATRACASNLPNGALLAIYPRRPAEQSYWRAVPGTGAGLFDLNMTAFRSGRHLACLLQRRTAASCREIALRLQ